MQLRAQATNVIAAVMVQIMLALSLSGCRIGDAAAGPLVLDSFVEDFSGPSGSLPNPEHWVIDIGPSAIHGWERGSLQTYTDSPENVRLDGQGNLVITARNDGDQFTSGRVVTRGRLEFGLGTLAARIKLPAGQGIWPAFWMLGSNIDDVGWPECGEIDIIELINDATTYHVALHGPGADPEAKGEIADLSLDFHEYWVTRAENSITIGIDDTALKTFTPEDLPPDSPWVFDGPMFALLNVAVGGTWPGPPDESTVFPATMVVDWLRFVPLAWTSR